MKKNRIRISVGLILVALVMAHVGNHLRIPFIDALESMIYDARLRLTVQHTQDSRVVILDIDEKSLTEPERGGEGRWPWPRDRVALLLDKLFQRYGVAAVGFDVIFAEADPSSGLRALETLAAGELRSLPQFQKALAHIKPQLDYDERLAQSIKNRPVVLGYTFQTVDAAKGAIPEPVLAAPSFGPSAPAAERYLGYTGNLLKLQQYAASAGHFNPKVDDDGITRRVPMLARFGDGYYEPLSLALVRLVAGLPRVLPVLADRERLSFDAIRIGRYTIPVDENAAVLVPFRGPQGSFAYHSLVDVLNDRVDPSALRGKIALVGASAPGLLDLRATPVDPAYPGVEIHANLIAGILDQKIKHKPPYAAGAEFVLILLVGLGMALWLPRLSAHPAILVTLAALIAAVGLNLSLYHYLHLVLPLASVLLLILLLFTWNMAYGFIVEGRSRREITGLFGQYVPPEVVEEIAKDPQKASMEGESREMSVLFTDVRGFTTISEGLDPKALAQLMNEFLTPLTEVIYRHRGTVDKYMGDCIMAFWGAPLADTSHARNGVLAALEMQRTLRQMQERFRSRNWPLIQIGVGVNSGRMSVGNMGSRVRLAYTVMGDAVNLASRLEGLTREYGVDIIVGEDTKSAVPDVVFREIDRVRVKGKDTAVAIFEPIGLVGAVDESTERQIDLFHEALRLYRTQDWNMAHQRLIELKRLQPDSVLYDTFIARIARLRVDPPAPSWDGAYTFGSK